MQWNLMLALVFALIVGVLAVANVESVSINYIFGSLQMPLILVIISSALIGGIIVGLMGLVRQAKLQWKIHNLDKQKRDLEQQLLKHQNNQVSVPGNLETKSHEDGSDHA